ncbi:MAG: FG-GAP repeat protein, partial [Deltaproteobacteria bacterium]|nr:FG-GAP repeat protein [Deltaproteobacteria bacterium]
MASGTTQCTRSGRDANRCICSPVGPYTNGQSGEGAAFLYLGSAGGLSAVAAWSAESDQASASFGSSVASAGDVNGDGYDDVVVGAHRYDNGQFGEGAVFLYLGSAAGLSATPAWTAEADRGGAWLGSTVASAGDVN